MRAGRRLQNFGKGLKKSGGFETVVEFKSITDGKFSIDVKSVEDQVMLYVKKALT